MFDVENRTRMSFTHFTSINSNSEYREPQVRNYTYTHVMEI